MTARATRIGLWLAAIAVIAGAILWTLLPVFVSSELVRTAIERELADIAGQEIRVEGRVDIDLFPAPVARLYEVHVPSDAAGEAPSDFLVVDAVEVSIPVASLLARDPVFSQFRFVRPIMRILVDEHGQVDFAAIGGRLGREIERMERETEAGSENGTPEQTDRPSDFARFGTVSIDGGIVEFVGPHEETPERITAVNGVISWPRLDERLTASLAGIWRGAAFDLETEIDEALQFFARRIVGVRQNFTSDVLTYSFDGKLGVGPTPFAEGKVTLNMPSPRRALDWLGAGLRAGSAVGSIALSGNIRGDDKKTRFENLNVDLQGSTGTGVLEVAVSDMGKPSVTATLDFAEIDILAFLSAFTGLPRTPDAFAEPVSRDILDQLDLDLRLSAASAKAGALRFSNIAAVTQIRNGGAVFELPDATAYGGRIQAHFKLGPDKDILIGTLGIALTDVNGAVAADTLQLTGLFPRGVTSGNVMINAPVEQWSDLFKRANGELTLNVVKGQLDGIAFRTFGGDGDRRTFFRLRDNDQTSEVFERFAVNALIQDGVIIVDNGIIEYPEGTVQLNGVIPYGTASIALTTIAEQRKDATTDVPAIQHFIGGSWSNPYATPVPLPRAEQ